MHLLFVTLALLVGESAASTQVIVTRIDGSTIAGELSEWSEQSIAVATAAVEVRVAPEELLSLRRPRSVSVNDDTKPAAVLVELTDGTLVPADQILVSGGQAAVTFPDVVPSDKREQRIPVRQVAAIQLRALDPAVAEQWNEIRAQVFSSDVLVVLKRDGKSLDYVEGVLGDISEEKIEFKLDDDSMRVDRAKVAALIYLRAETQERPEPVCTVHGRSGLRAHASQARLTDRLLSVSTSGGANFEWPLEDIEFVDYSAGKILYLSDIEQATVRFTPLVALPGLAQVAAKYGQPRRDQAAYGGPLTLAIRDSESSAASFQLRTYSKGLSLHSRTEMVFRLPTGYQQFVATAGIEPGAGSAGNVQFTIHGDDRPLFEANIASGVPPQEIELDISGIKRLKLVVDFGKNLDTGDWLNLCEARLIK